MTTDDVYSAVVKWIYDVTSVTTIRAHEGETRPALPYIMVNLISSDVEPNPRAYVFVEAGNTTPEGKAETTQAPLMDGEWNFSVHAYGENPVAPLQKLKAAQQIAIAIEGLYPLKPLPLSKIRHIPEMINAEWEYRANCDLTVKGSIVDLNFTVNPIEETTQPEINS